jgi:predicted DNA-binding protein (MmcQ/YjbR family)
MPAKTRSGDAFIEELRAFGLTYPGAHTKSPWPGHLDLAVNDKTFAYLSVKGEPPSVSCKLPESAAVALTMPFVQPAAYGLGKSGWVAAALDEKALPPVELFKSWIDESYRAQAPKKLVARLAAGASARETKPKSAKKSAAQKSAAKKSAAKKQPTRPAAKKSAKKKIARKH